MIPYVAPAFKERGFNCPHCRAYAHQQWGSMVLDTGTGLKPYPAIWIATCSLCRKFSLWLYEKLVYPEATIAEPANLDLPDDVRADYEEAANIVAKSPRGAAALLRLAIQKLCKHLGEKGKNLNTDIGNLVKKGLPKEVQKALDSVRVIGNESVHPGEMDLRDNIDTALALFRCVNVIADRMITQRKELDALYSSLPENKLKEIEQRDSPGDSKS